MSACRWQAGSDSVQHETSSRETNRHWYDIQQITSHTSGHNWVSE